MDTESLEGYGCVKTWKDSLIANSRKGSLSDRQWAGLKSHMGIYMEFVASGPDAGMTPEDLIQEGLEDPDKARARLMKWYNWLQGGEVDGYEPWMKKDKPHRISQGSAVTYQGRVRGFYTHNKVVFGKWRMPNRRPGRTRRADSNLDVFKYDEENGEIYVDNPLLQQFMANLSFRDQTIALAMLSTSQDSVDLFKLTLGWLKAQEGKSRLYWEGNRTKTGEPFKVFFSKEATEFVWRYIGQERRDAGDDEPVWVTGKEYSYRYNGERVRVGGVMTSQALNDNFRTAAEAMDVTENGNPNPLRPKRFRHLFRTACTSAGLDPGVAQAFMGHATPISAKYLSQGKAFLLSQYVHVEPFVTVFKSRDMDQIQDIKADLNAARRERDELKIELIKVGKKYDAEAEQIRRRNAALEDKVDAHRKELEGHAGFIEDLRGELEANDRLFDLLTRFLFEKKEAGLEEWEKWLEEHEYP